MIHPPTLILAILAAACFLGTPGYKHELGLYLRPGPGLAGSVFLVGAFLAHGLHVIADRIDRAAKILAAARQLLAAASQGLTPAPPAS